MATRCPARRRIRDYLNILDVSKLTTATHGQSIQKLPRSMARTSMNPMYGMGMAAVEDIIPSATAQLSSTQFHPFGDGLCYGVELPRNRSLPEATINDAPHLSTFRRQRRILMDSLLVVRPRRRRLLRGWHVRGEPEGFRHAGAIGRVGFSAVSDVPLLYLETSASHGARGVLE